MYIAINISHPDSKGVKRIFPKDFVPDYYLQNYSPQVLTRKNVFRIFTNF